MIARPYAVKKLQGNRSLWKQMPSSAYTQYVFEAGVINGKVYCPAGVYNEGYTNVTRVYDPKAKAWSTAADITTSRQGASTAVVNGFMYVIGGIKLGNVYQNLNECYNPVLNSWSSKTVMTAAKELAFCAAVGTKIYMIGGFNGAAVSTNYCYDTVADSWSTKTAMTAAKYSGGCIVYGAKIYCISGYNASAIDSTVYCYDTLADSWSTKTAIPTAVYNIQGQAQRIGKYVYILGGYNSSPTPINTIQRYDIEADKWTTDGTMPVSRHSAASTIVDDELYIIGGADASSAVATLYKNTFKQDADYLINPAVSMLSHTDNRAFKGVG